MIEEVLFGLTMIFVGYVLYEVLKIVKSSDEGHHTHIQPVAKSEEKVVTKPAPAAPKAATVKPKAAPKAEAAPAASTPVVASAAAVEEKAVTLRDPASGESTALPSNYRFAKKWIKEAMVKEGLLPKVYKNSELKGELNGQVKSALEKFKDIKKYHA